MENRNLTYCDLGLIDYQEAWNLQKEIFDLRYKNEISDVLFLLEHPNTYTLGKVADKNHLISSSQYLEKNKISVYDIDRGGDITYHGPGQIVGYPIINLDEWERDTHKYLRALEEVIIRVCTEFGLIANRNSSYTGVWIGNKKIAAIGIKVSRWITMHGFAFNANTDLSLFQGIVPCGITDKEVTSLKKELGKELDLNQVKEMIFKYFVEVFRYDSKEKSSLNEIRFSSISDHKQQV
jgi:lipoyl(octanoyl) transferase